MKITINKRFYILVYEADEFFILRFLWCCKFDVDKTKIKMKNYFDQRAALPNWYAERKPFDPKVQEFLNLG